jgi:hypothetical protein
MTRPKHKIVAWETDSNCNPTGPERFFVSESCRTVAKQIAYELNGEARYTMVYLPDGKRWATTIYEKGK